jgi:uncharacterized protein YfaS (alpha-2-macroglobulin family)
MAQKFVPLFWFSASLMLGALLAACAGQPSATPSPPPEAQPTPAPEDLSPLLTTPQAPAPLAELTKPAAGEEAALKDEIEIQFDQPMDAASVETAFRISAAQGAAVPGKFRWLDSRKLRFQPAQPLQPAAEYTITIETTAAAQSGVKLDAPLTFRFRTVTPLQAAQVFPADGSDQVQTSTQITVIFNRPVVALGIQEEQADLPQPLTFDPPVSGTGDWVNTSVYVFQPEKPLRTGTQYTVTIRKGLTDSTGSADSAMPQDFQWKFTTLPPQVAEVQIGKDTVAMQNPYKPVHISITPQLSVTFRQPMDKTSVEKALRLFTETETIPLGRFQWDKDAKKVTFAPLSYLRLGTDYALQIRPEASAADGGALGEQLNFVFQTISAPEIRYAGPCNGSLDAGDTCFKIGFATLMDTKSLASRVIFSPALEDAENWYYDDYNQEAVWWGLKTSTRYTVRILPGMRDIYGNAINQPMTVSFLTAPMPAAITLRMPDSPIYRVGAPQEFFVTYTNIQQATFEIYRVSEMNFITFAGRYGDQQQYSPAESALVWRYVEQSQAALDETVTKAISFSGADGSPLPPGYYFLGMDSPQVTFPSKGRFLEGRFFMVASANLTLKLSSGDGLLWVTDFTSGKPLADTAVKVVNSNDETIIKGKTDGDGLFKFDLPKADSQNDRGYFAIAEDSGGRFGFASSYWWSGVSPEDFGIWASYYIRPIQRTAYLYTDRPLYRPGQTVYFKGIVRLDRDLAYRLPEKNQIEVIFYNYDLEEVFRQTLPLSPFGSFNGSFLLDENAALGGYTIQAKFPGEEDVIGYLYFTVAEYRKPEFVVTLDVEPQNVLFGGEVRARISAQYYAGGGLSGAEVQWALRSSPDYFSPGGNLAGYSFYDDTDLPPEVEQRERETRTLSEGSGVTDENGELTLTLPVDVYTASPGRRLTLEVTVTDVAGTSVSSTAQLSAHRSTVYAGVRPANYVGRAGEEQQFDLIAVNWEGQAVAGQKLNVVISRREWYSVQQQDAQGVLRWVSSVKDTPLAEFSDVVTDSEGKASVRFTPPQGGVYRARVTAVDPQGHTASATAYLWVSGKEYVPWQQSNDRTFRMVADRDEYKPGDTAELLLASPFQGEVYALVTVERGLIRSQKVIKLTGNSELYRLPITADMAPLVYVSALVIKGVDETNPRPDFKMAIASLNVSTEKQQLRVEVQPDRKQAAPGEQVTYTVQVSDLEGKPVQAEVSLSLADLAVLALSDPNSIPILDHFYARRGLSVATSLSLSRNIEEFNAQMAAMVAEGKAAGSGGGKGGGIPGVPEVRQKFVDTAYWRADLTTDENGSAAVTLTLPDNLTTWRMDARAVTKDTRVGQTTVDLLSTKPLLVRPQTPRFFVAGDRAVLGAGINNNSGENLTVEVTLAEAKGLKVNSPLTQTVRIPAGKQAYVSWECEVLADAQRVDLVFSAKGGAYSDASRPTLGTLEGQGIPVYRYEAPETVSTSGDLAEDGARSEGIRLPAQMDVKEGQLEVVMEPSLAAGMRAGLDYLKHYPYECVEQTASRLLANVLTRRAMQAAGVENAELTENLKTQVNTALQRLYNQQNSDGGWGWWGGGVSSPLTTAYAVLGLVEAQEADYTVDREVLNRALDYLDGQADQLMADRAGYARGGRNTLAFVLYVLQRGGRPDVSLTTRLYDDWQSLALYARAFLARTLYDVDPADSRLKNLTSHLVDSASLSAAGAHWEEPQSDRWNWNTDARTTAIVLGTLIHIDPQNALNVSAVRWLMRNRVDGHWRSTQETAWTLMALTDWMIQSGEMQANYAYAVALNGEELGRWQVTPAALEETQTLRVEVAKLLKDATNRLVVARSEGAGHLYYTANLKVYLPVPQIKALDQGIILTRRYYALNDNRTPITAARQGDLVRVRLTVVVPQSVHYLLVEDPLPAGLEAVDTSLKTSPQGYVPEAQDWQRMDGLGWGWWHFNHVELRDEKVVLSADYLPAGSYTYTYLARASTVGTFQVIPPTAQEFYFPDVYGRGEGSLFEVKP